MITGVERRRKWSAEEKAEIVGIIHDATGSCRLAFVLAIACCLVSALAIWMASPRKVRLVPGRM